MVWATIWRRMWRYWLNLYSTELLDSLDYAERRSREIQLQNSDANEESFSWIWSSPSSFGSWLSSCEGVYWISGKPGSGKSTLVDYLVHDRTKVKLQQHSHEDWIVLRFFFDFRGGKGLQNNFEGLLRSLLYQLIKEMPHIDSLGLDDSKEDSFSGWHERRLRDTLHSALSKIIGGVCIFVDGLDEYEGSVLRLIQFLRSLATSNDRQKTLTKVCVSSRPEPIPAQLLQHLPNLSISDHNESGIRSYCRLTIEGLGSEAHEDLDISQLSHTIARRAEGVFLWARFALEELILGYCEAEDTNELLERLEKIPQSLEEVYDRMLGRLEPAAKKECMIMLQLVRFAKRGLLWQELLVATEIAMDKDVILTERTDPKECKLFAKRLRAKAAGLLELVNKEDAFNKSFLTPKLIHRSVSTYLNQKGWQTLGGLAEDNSVEHESFYADTCTRYLHRLLRHCNLEKNTSQIIWEEWFDENVFYWLVSRKPNSVGVYPFFTYAACYIFEHASFLERHGASSYGLLHKSLTEQIACLHIYCVIRLDADLCQRCYRVPREWVFERFDATYMAFLHGLVLYCQSDLANRSPGQFFWNRALRCALFSSESWDDEHASEVQEAVSLALQNITTVQQFHLEQALVKPEVGPRRWTLHSAGIVKLVLQHESIETLRLVDSNGQAVTLLWLFTQIGDWQPSEELLSWLIEGANRRGEDIRQPCCLEGNLIETLLKQSPTPNRSVKLQRLRMYYESMSWPFESDSVEIERKGQDVPIRRDSLSEKDSDETEGDR